MHNALVYTSALVILCGCIGSSYKPPHHAMPTSFSSSSTAQQNEPESSWWKQFEHTALTHLIEQAVADNYDLKQAMQRIEQARARYQVASSQLFPQAAMVGDVTRSLNKNPCADSADRSTFFRWGFDGIWEVDFWGKIWHGKQAGYYAFESHIEQMRLVHLVIIAEVAQTFINLCSIYKKIALQKNILQYNQAIINLTNNAVVSGLENISSWHQTMREQDQARSTLADFCAEFAQLKHKLAFLCGHNPQDFSLPDSWLKSIPLAHTTIATGLPSDLLRRRPDIRQAERELAMTHALVNQSVAQWFPSFTIFGGVGHEASTPLPFFSNESLTWSIGPGIRWPILQFGRISAQVAERKAAEKEALITYSSRVTRALQEVEDFLAGYRQAQISLDHAQQAYCHSIAIKKLEHERFSRGLFSQRALLQTQKDAALAQILVADRTSLVSTNVVSLYKALGGGW